MDGARQNRRARAVAVAAGLTVVAVAAGCGSGGGGEASRPRVDAGGRTAAASTAAAGVAPAPGNQVVRFGDAEFEVPASWPVHDLAADPTTCVRFDEHAVYLGSPGEAMRCPAGVFGRTDAVLVEPLSSSSVTADATSVTEVNGMAAAADPVAPIEQQLRVAFADLGIAVTVSFTERSQADAILASIRAVTP
jgi:hypothetical protein